jgi:hypothetical protein
MNDQESEDFVRIQGVLATGPTVRRVQMDTPNDVFDHWLLQVGSFQRGLRGYDR